MTLCKKHQVRIGKRLLIWAVLSLAIPYPSVRAEGFLTRCEEMANAWMQRFKRREPATQERPPLFKLIDDLTPALVELANQHRCNLTDNFCRGGAGTLAEMLIQRNIKTEPVFNGFHTFLLIKDYFEPGKDLVIDPTYQQFLPVGIRRRLPLIFVGSKDELLKILTKNGAYYSHVDGYFRNLVPEKGLPTYFDDP